MSHLRGGTESKSTRGTQTVSASLSCLAPNPPLIDGRRERDGPRDTPPLKSCWTGTHSLLCLRSTHLIATQLIVPDRCPLVVGRGGAGARRWRRQVLQRRPGSVPRLDPGHRLPAASHIPALTPKAVGDSKRFFPIERTIALDQKRGPLF